MPCTSQRSVSESLLNGLTSNYNHVIIQGMETFLTYGMWGFIAFALVYSVGGALIDGYRDSKTTQLVSLDPAKKFAGFVFAAYEPGGTIRFLESPTSLPGPFWSYMGEYRCTHGSCTICGPIDWAEEDWGLA